MSYVNIRLTQGQTEFLLNRLSADKAACLEEARKAVKLGDVKAHKFNRTLANRLSPIINELYLELNTAKEMYNGR